MTINLILGIFNLGGGEITLIILGLVFLFGGKKIPELARGLGKGIREFKDASKGESKEINSTTEEKK